MGPILPGFSPSQCLPLTHHHGIVTRGGLSLGPLSRPPARSLTVAPPMMVKGEAQQVLAGTCSKGVAALRVGAPGAAFRTMMRAIWSRMTLTAFTLALMLLGSITSLPSSASARSSAARSSPLSRLHVDAEDGRGPGLQLLNVDKRPGVVVARADSKAEAQAKVKKAKEAKAREAKAREAKAREAKAREAKAKEAKAREAKERETKAREAKEREAKAREAKAKAAKESQKDAQKRNLKPAPRSKTVKQGSNVMLSMKTAEQKQRLIALVSGAYVVVWAFFYFTHDSGEVSE